MTLRKILIIDHLSDFQKRKKNLVALVILVKRRGLETTTGMFAGINAGMQTYTKSTCCQETNDIQDILYNGKELHKGIYFYF